MFSIDEDVHPKMFSNGKSTCPGVRYFKKLLAVLKPKQNALFQKPKRNFMSGDQIWFENCPIGVKKIGSMMKEISKDANLSHVYSNHCVRSTTVTVLDAAGIPIHRIMQTSGHRNESSVKFYCDRQTVGEGKGILKYPREIWERIASTSTAGARTRRQHTVTASPKSSAKQHCRQC